MIIKCENCGKKFTVKSVLIPVNGRQIQCSSCNHIWYFIKKKSPIKPKNIDIKNENQDFTLDENIKIVKNPISISDNTPLSMKINTNKVISSKTDRRHPNEINVNKINNFLSYLIVFIISFVALIILIDTLKLSLINFIPGIEIVLFNLFETLKDIKLFIIDLT